MKLQRCSLLQLTVHVALVFAVGFWIGLSLRPQAQLLEASMLKDLFSAQDDIESLSALWGSTIDYFDKGKRTATLAANQRYQTFCEKRFASNIANANNHIEYDISSYDFEETPSVLVSINGLTYAPDPVPGYGIKEGLFVELISVTKAHVRLKVISNYQAVNPNSIAEIDACVLLIQNPKEYSLSAHRPNVKGV